MKIMGVILFVVLIFYAVYQNYKVQDDLAYQNAYHAVTDFVDNVRSKGYITPKMYEDFQRELELGSYTFNVEMKHQQKIYTPVYADPNDESSFKNEFVIDYDEYYKSQIEKVLFDESNSIPKNKRMYKLQEGDFFEMSVVNLHKTNATMLLDFLTANTLGSDSSTIVIPYGGMVLNEDY